MFINKSYVFPVCNLKLCEPKLTADDTLDLHIALKDEKKRTHNLINTTETINVKLQKVEEEKSIADNNNLSIDELKMNLKTLIRQAVVKDSESNQEKHLLVGKRVRHRFHEDDGDKWYTGKIISQVY